MTSIVPGAPARKGGDNLKQGPNFVANCRGIRTHGTWRELLGHKLHTNLGQFAMAQNGPLGAHLSQVARTLPTNPGPGATPVVCPAQAQ